MEESVDRFQPDKLVHVVLFLVFTFLLLRGFDRAQMDERALSDFYFFAVIAGILLGGGTEIFQHFFIFDRKASLKDFLFNTLGCLLGWVIYQYLRGVSNNRFRGLHRLIFKH